MEVKFGGGGGSKAPRARMMGRPGEAGEPAEGCAFPRSVARTRVCSNSGSCDSAAKSRRQIYCDAAGKGRQEKTGDFGGRTHVLRGIIPRGGGRASSLSAASPGRASSERKAERGPDGWEWRGPALLSVRLLPYPSTAARSRVGACDRLLAAGGGGVCVCVTVE